MGLGKHKTVDDIEAQNDEYGLPKLERWESLPIAQHYNPERSLIHEVSRPANLNLTVAVEQVSMFLTVDRTLITFFQVLPLLNVLIIAIWPND